MCYTAGVVATDGDVDDDNGGVRCDGGGADDEKIGQTQVLFNLYHSLYQYNIINIL